MIRLVRCRHRDPLDKYMFKLGKPTRHLILDSLTMRGYRLAAPPTHGGHGRDRLHSEGTPSHRTGSSCYKAGRQQPRPGCSVPSRFGPLLPPLVSPTGTCPWTGTFYHCMRRATYSWIPQGGRRRQTAGDARARMLRTGTTVRGLTCQRRCRTILLNS